jgi:hypothetical protein
MPNVFFVHFVYFTFHFSGSHDTSMPLDALHAVYYASATICFEIHLSVLTPHIFLHNHLPQKA